MPHSFSVKVKQIKRRKLEIENDYFLGLDDSIYPYAHYFINNNMTGQGLLNITVDDLYKLHVEKLGHQEIILEGLDHLKNLVRVQANSKDNAIIC